MDDRRWEDKAPELFPWAMTMAMDRDSITVASSKLLAAAEPLATRRVGRDWSRCFAAMRSCRRLLLGPACL